MSRSLLAVLMAVAMLPAAEASAQDATAEAAIRAIVAEQTAAWNAGDGDGYASKLAPEASFTNLFGMVMYGAPAFANRQKEILATFYKNTTKKQVVRRIRFVTADVAIVDIDNEVHGVKAMPAGIVVPPDGVMKTQLMQVFVNRGGQWWVEAFHNVDTKPAATPVANPQPSRSDILVAGRDVMQKVRYCTFITIGDDGHPQARIVDPVAPDAAFVTFVATNPLTRKVKEITRDPRVTLSCFDTASSSYMTLLATATIVTDATEKARRWKAEWDPFYPGGAKGTAYTLIRLMPVRLEVVSASRGLEGDAKTWRPLTVDFPLK